jgi:fructose-specific phosphotransferase system IIA component
MSASKLSNLLAPSRIRIELKARKKEEALAELLDLLESEGKIPDRQAVLEALLEREKLAPTGIGSGVAIPHVFVESLSETLVALGMKRKGIGFNSIDRKPARLIFLILGPENQAAGHLQLLSRMARYLRIPEFRSALLSARDPQEVLGVIERMEKEDR